MAIVLSTSNSALLEPKRANRWVVSFDKIPGGLTGAEDALTFAAFSGARPNITFGEGNVDRINEKWNFAGKPTWTPIQFAFYDFLAGSFSAGDILNSWRKQIYNPITGQMGYAIEYKTHATVGMLDPKGTVKQAWHIFYAYPNNVDFDTLTYGGEDILKVTTSIKYDYAIPSDEEDVTGLNADIGTYPTLKSK
jgi:hypothetical protein